jgi:ribonuclease P protein component
LEGFFNFVSLETKARYRLGKNDRLKSRKAIEHLFAKGNSFSISPLRILYTLSPTANPADSAMNLQVGFAVSTRNFKKAVHRNRIKRLMREAWRLQKNELQLSPLLAGQSLNLFLIYTGKELPAYTMIFEKIALVITRLLKLADEKK